LKGERRLRFGVFAGILGGTRGLKGDFGRPGLNLGGGGRGGAGFGTFFIEGAFRGGTEGGTTSRGGIVLAFKLSRDLGGDGLGGAIFGLLMRGLSDLRACILSFLLPLVENLGGGGLGGGAGVDSLGLSIPSRRRGGGGLGGFCFAISGGGGRGGLSGTFARLATFGGGGLAGGGFFWSILGGGGFAGGGWFWLRFGGGGLGGGGRF